MTRQLMALLQALFFGLLTSAAPTPTRKTASKCGQWDKVETGSYITYNNLWDKDSADSGKQCFGVNSLKDEKLSWFTTWSWTGGADKVKSYSNTEVNFKSKQISAIKSMPSLWAWSYDGSSLRADVAYDLFTSSTADGEKEYEIMVWLAKYGDVGPISEKYSADGSATATATTNIADIEWNVYKGSNGQQTVYSFVAPKHVTKFDGDLAQFSRYLVDQHGFPKTQYLVSAGAGTEAFTGKDARFETSEYSLKVN